MEQYKNNKNKNIKKSFDHGQNRFLYFIQPVVKNLVKLVKNSTEEKSYILKKNKDGIIH